MTVSFETVFQSRSTPTTPPKEHRRTTCLADYHEQKSQLHNVLFPSNTVYVVFYYWPTGNEINFSCLLLLVTSLHASKWQVLSGIRQDLSAPSLRPNSNLLTKVNLTTPKATATRRTTKVQKKQEKQKEDQHRDNHAIVQCSSHSFPRFHHTLVHKQDDHGWWSFGWRRRRRDGIVILVAGQCSCRRSRNHQQEAIISRRSLRCSGGYGQGGPIREPFQRFLPTPFWL